MKTPREILFKKHQDAESKLDAVRARALSEMVSVTRNAQPEPRPRVSYWLQELIHSFRPHLAALAAVWLIIFGLHLASSESSGAGLITAAAPSPEIMATLQAQKQLYTQLIGPADMVQPVQPALPDRRPRSEEKQLVRIV